MTDTVAPEGTEKKEPDFTYGRDEKGRLLVDGHMFDDGFLTVTDDPDDEVAEGGPNAQVEGAEVAEPEVAVTEEEAEAKAPEPEPAPEPVEPDKKVYKYKAQGEEFEESLDEKELLARLSMAQDYYQKTTKLAEDRKKIDPFLPIIEKPEFRQWLGEQVEAGVIDAPKVAAPPDPEDVINYQLNMQEPEFEEIRHSMSAWAATLPTYEREVLDSNHRAFNQAYIRFKTARAERITPPPPTVKATDTKTMEKIIQSKEVAKKDAAVIPPGGQTPEVDPNKEWKRIDRELRKAVREGRSEVKYQGRRVDPETAWALHRFGESED